MILPFFRIYKNKEEYNMTSANASDIVESYRGALGKGDFDTARRLMQDNMTFQGPLDTFNTADQYLEAARRLASIIQRIDLKKVFVDGDDVCVLYEMVTSTPAGTAFIAEWYQVKDGKIAALRAVFDARPFAALFGRWSSSLLCNCLKELEFLAIHLQSNDRNDNAFHKALETPARVHSRGNLHMRLLLVFYRGHHKGRHHVLNRVDILLDQDPAWFWLADTL